MPGFGADKKDSRFSPGTASSYSSKQTNDNVTVAVIAYDTEELAHKAFGKLNPYQYGAPPVLVIIQNDTAQSMRLDTMQLQYEALDGDKIDNTPTQDVRYIGSAPKRPQPNMGSPIPPGLFKKKNPLDAWEIEGRAFAAQILPPGQSASGFFYFQTGLQRGATIYLAGMTEAGTGKELFYFELPLQ